MYKHVKYVCVHDLTYFSQKRKNICYCFIYSKFYIKIIFLQLKKNIFLKKLALTKKCCVPCSFIVLKSFIVMLY